MIKPEDLTDEMIRELLAYAFDVTGDRETAQIAQVALGVWHGSHEWKASGEDYTPACAHVHDYGRRCGSFVDESTVHIAAARARCAEILSARMAKESLDDDGHIRDCGNGGSDPSDCSPACLNARAAKSEGK